MYNEVGYLVHVNPIFSSFSSGSVSTTSWEKILVLRKCAGEVVHCRILDFLFVCLFLKTGHMRVLTLSQKTVWGHKDPNNKLKDTKKAAVD